RMIGYASEARGYAPAAFFLVVGYVLWKKNPIGFGVAIVLAMLSHLSAVAVYLGFFSVDVVRRDWKKHILPIAFGAWYYVVKVRHLVAGGGPRWSPTPLAIAIAVATAAIVAVEIVRRARARDLDALFFGVALIVGPAIAAATYRCPSVLPRHFFVCLPFVLVL